VRYAAVRVAQAVPNFTVMAPLTGDLPRGISRPAWLTARAKNAAQRPVVIGTVGVGAFVAALVALILAPQQVRQTHLTASAAIPRPDTAAFADALAHARARLSTAESSLAEARSHPSPPQPVEDTPNPAAIAQRDSLSAAVSDLDALLARVETAPVSASYRALAESPQLASVPRVKSLLDSLSEIERDRDALGTTAAGDPVYVALTSRAAEIGRAIQASGQSRRDSIRQQIALLNMPLQRVVVTPTPVLDTASWVAERDSAESLVRQAVTALADARAKARDFDRDAARAREAATRSAPPVALLAAALVIGIALGFGSAFFDELRQPRVSNEHELERVTGSRVLATIRPRPRDPDRDRRLSDRMAPPYFDPGAAGYQLTYLHVSRTGASRLVLTIVASDTSLAAVVGMNVAAIAADEARSAIIIDTDARALPVAAALRTHAEPGIADIVRDHIDWSEVTTQTMIGRDRVLDVIASGVSATRLEPAAVTELFRQEANRLARHYEAIIVIADVEQAAAGLAGALPIPDTIVCARLGHTRLADLQKMLDGVRNAGGNPLGVVLWDSLPPALPTPERIAAAPRPLHTTEMRALTSGR
jgi:Mrp family chromosome partitioning ATPase